MVTRQPRQYEVHQKNEIQELVDGSFLPGDKLVERLHSYRIHQSLIRVMLCQRFFQSTWHFGWYLKFIGVYLDGSGSKSWPTWLSILWTGFWLILNLQSAIFLLLERGYNSLIGLFHTKKMHSSQMDALMNVMMAINPFFFACLSHIDLALFVKRSIKDFLNCLQSVDTQLGCPPLFHLRRYSVVAVAWIISKVSFD